jgi:hypothetical protein
MEHVAAPDKVAVYLSHIHGKGIFATHDVVTGDILTRYPEHARKLADGTVLVSVTGKKMGMELTEMIWKDYALNIGDDVKIVAHPDVMDDGVAHLANDAVGPEDILIYSLLELEPQQIKDKIAAEAQCNSKFTVEPDTGRILLVATRNISVREEVLVHYGLKYWLSWMLRNNWA